MDIINTSAFLKISSGVVVNLVTNEYIILRTQCMFTCQPKNRILYYNGRRMLETYPYYVQNHEFKYGPFRCFEEAYQELQYLNDPLGNNYIPNANYEITNRNVFYA